MALREYFKEILKNKTQAKIADEIVINKKTFSAHLCGTRNPNRNTCSRYIAYLAKHGICITLEDIYGF